MNGLEEPIPALSIGCIVGGPCPESEAWGRAAMALSRLVGESRGGVESALRVNVVYQIPGPLLTPKFDGVRTGRYSRSMRLLLVQAAVPAELPESPNAVLLELLRQSIEEAAIFARKRKIANDLVELRRLVAAL